jgi:hypothetical protein
MNSTAGPFGKLGAALHLSHHTDDDFSVQDDIKKKPYLDSPWVHTSKCLRELR